MDDLSVMAYEMRKDVLDMICRAGTGHIGGDFSVMEILTDLYFRQMNISPELMDDRDRDRFVLSKGHSVESYYAVLARKGFLDIEDVKARFSAFDFTESWLFAVPTLVSEESPENKTFELESKI